MTRRRRILLVLAAVAGVFAAYQIATGFIAYTADAYVRSDLVAVAPEVTGRIASVHVADNQNVARDDLLATIDPVPFQLDVDQRRAEMNEAHAQVAADEDSVAAAEAALTAATAAAAYAHETHARLATLATDQFAARADLQKADDDMRQADAAVDAAQAAIGRAQAMAAMHQAAEARATAALATATWQLTRTRLTAPTDGSIVNLTVRPGDTARANQPLVGIVDAHAWRIVANFKQSFIRGFPAWRNGLGMARLAALASAPRPNPGHCARHQPRPGAGSPAGLCPANNRLDPAAAPLPRHPDPGRSAARPDAVHGCRCPGPDPAVIRPFAAVAPLVSILHAAGSALRAELADLHLTAERGPRCAMTALAVVLAVTAALALQLDDAWWAGISGFVSIQATTPASLRRGVLRIIGTCAGAMAAVLLSPWLAEDPPALMLVLFAASTVGVLGLLVSPHGYAWLLGAVTTDMVLLALLADPLAALEVAASRTAEVATGTAAAVLVALLLAPQADAAPGVNPPGWVDLTGRQWSAVQHALRTGIGVVLVPLVWRWLELPSLSQAAVTVAAVMAVPALSADDAANQRTVTERALHRLLGCVLRGLAGLACLAASLDSVLPWLLLLAAGVWLAAHVQASARGIGYVGTQGAVVFICTLVQGPAPPQSILPGISRFAGITGGLLILLAVSVLTAPSTGVPVRDRR